MRLLLVELAALTHAGTAGADLAIPFRTPSGNIGYELAPTGRARLTCHGDTAIDPTSRVLRYGTRWSRSGFTCTSRKAGLRCSNRSRHGFLLSRARSYRF